jgi:tetratricopeptide (TPR) repeat protein
MSSRHVLWLSLALVGAGLVGCVEGVEPASDRACDCAEEQVVDPALLAFLSKAKVAHHQADMAEEDEDPQQAIDALQKLVDGPVPGGSNPPPEAREVLGDTLARLAELKSGLADFDRAKKDVERGLALAREITHYRGRLLEVLGVVEQRLHKQLLEDGNQELAAAAKARAIKAFGDAVEVQDEVIKRALGDLPPVPEDPGPKGAPTPSP